MATREERIRIAILGAAEGARDMDRLGKATEKLGGEFVELGRDADKLDRKLDELKSSQRELAAEFARTGDADVGRKLRGVTADISTTMSARKALVGDLEDVLDEADRASERRAKDEIRRQALVAKAADKAAAVTKRASEQHSRDLERLADRFKHLGTNALNAAQAVGRSGATIAAVASLAGPAISGLLGTAKAVAAVGKGLATLPPLAAALPSLIGGFALVVGTVKMAGPAIGKALMPIGDAFKNIQGRVGALASRGLPELARGFVKANFPAIRKAMLDIAESINFVTRETGAWINSKSGQQAIRQITEATSKAMRELAEPLSSVVFSFGEMVKRIGGRAIGGAATAMDKLAGATARWMDSIDNADIDTALRSLTGWGGKLRDTFVALRDVGRWMADNEEKVKHFSDVVAGTAIVLGIATGNWVAVLAGSFSLAVNHWDELKKAFSDTGPIKKTFESLRNDPHLRDWAESVRAAFDGFRDSFNEATKDIGPKFVKLIEQLKVAWDEWGPVIQAWWDGVGKPVFSALGTALGFFLEHMITSMTVSAVLLDKLGEAFKFLWQVVSQYLGYIIGAAATAFGWVPGIGPKLKKAAEDFNAFKDRVNDALNKIDDEDVFINIKQRGTVGVTGSNEAFNLKVGRRAAGGPVFAGRPYIAGEQGPELITPQRNGFVHTAAQTRRMLSGTTASSTASMTFSGDTSSWLAQAVMNGVRTGLIVLKVGGQRVAI